MMFAIATILALTFLLGIVCGAGYYDSAWRKRRLARKRKDARSRRKVRWY